MIPQNYKNKVSRDSHWLNRKNPTLDHIKILKKFVKKSKGMVLDAGCAEGENSKIFQDEGFRVAGLDYDKNLLKIARKNHPKIKFHLGNVEKMTFKSNLFDVSYCINTLFYTDLSKSVPELLRVTKSGGLVFITFDIRITDLDKDRVIHRSSLKDLKENIKDLGEIIFIKKKRRTDYTPFKHAHEFYEVVVRKL